MQKLKKGQKFIIRVSGRVIHGVAINGDNWGTEEEPNWYIEFNHAVSPTQGGGVGGYGYYKQKFDGGTVEFPED